MYGGLCCYCETEIGVVAFEHIEHRRPKARFPKHCFDWGNLHLACPKCNQAKGDNWNGRSPILDAVRDSPIGTHMTYDWREVLGVIRSAKTKRGCTTIDHADLNRERLRGVRTKVAHG
ncbi:MAG: HNH endonuclease, partial [Planctomycetes bacterium]|nr:HNH endonuclease [Planctomycetota bacterium]